MSRSFFMILLFIHSSRRKNISQALKTPLRSIRLSVAYNSTSTPFTTKGEERGGRGSKKANLLRRLHVVLVMQKKTEKTSVYQLRGDIPYLR